jgi:hypothetical protein
MNFDKLSLLYSLTWDADWVSAVSFIGPNRVAAGNLRGEILQWDLPANPEKLPEPAPVPANAAGASGSANENRSTCRRRRRANSPGTATASIACCAWKIAG